MATQTEKKQTISVIGRLLKTDISVINQQQIGSLHGRIFRSIQGLIRIIKLAFLEFLPALSSGVGAVIIALSQKPLLASVMMLVIPTGIFIIIKQISSQKGVRLALLRGKEKIDGAVVEMLGGIETVRVLNTAETELKKIEGIAEDLRRKEIRHHIFMAFFDSGKYLNEGFFHILVISLSILLSAQGFITRGDILVYSILYLSITGPLREIHRILDEAHESSISVNDLYELLSEPVDESFAVGKRGNNQLVIAGNVIQAKDLSFSYANDAAKLLSNVSFNIKSGEKIGIVGVSGCGKTTLIKILLKLVHGYGGEISIFGKNIKDITREEIAEKVAYVPQKPYIFSGTIGENITYGCSRTEISGNEVVEAAKRASIYNEIVGVLGGFEGKVSENGNNLSGGQRQRLAIARLILSSPDLFIFDEATSALDNTNENIIQGNINSLFGDKTMITIAHRLTTLRNSDCIFVLDKGEIIQEGTFSHLSAKAGQFQEFLNQGKYN